MLLFGVPGQGKQSLARLATFVNGFSAFQVVITARYGVNDLKADLQIMYRKAGLKGEGISFIFTDQQIAEDFFKSVDYQQYAISLASPLSLPSPPPISPHPPPPHRPPPPSPPPSHPLFLYDSWTSEI